MGPARPESPCGPTGPWAPWGPAPPGAPAAPCGPSSPGGPVTPSAPVGPWGPTVSQVSEVREPQGTLIPLILPLEAIQIVSVAAWPTLGSAASNSNAAAVVPTIQRHANFGEAGMLTPSIFFCPLAVHRSDNEVIIHSCHFYSASVLWIA